MCEGYEKCRGVGMFRRGLSVIAAAVVCVVSATGLASADGLYGQFWVYGSIERGYLETGGPNRWGNPTSPEQDAARGGKFQTFGDSSFYWHPNVDPDRGFQVGGLIGAKWGQLGWENGALRYPATHELKTPDGYGRFNFFEGGAIYWSPATGAHPVWGQILETWAGSGYEKSWYGYPTSDEYEIDGGKAQNFQGGIIEWKQYGYPGDWIEDPNTDPNSIYTQDAASSGIDSPPQLVSVFDNTGTSQRAIPQPLAIQDVATASCSTTEILPEGAMCIEREDAGDRIASPQRESATPDAEPSPSDSPVHKDPHVSELFRTVAPNMQTTFGPYWCDEFWRGGTSYVCQERSGARQVTYVVYQIVNGKKVEKGSITGNEYREVAPAWNSTDVPFLYDFTITATTGAATGARLSATPYCTPEPICPITSPTNPKEVYVIAQSGARIHGLWNAETIISTRLAQAFDLRLKMVVSGAGAASGSFDLGYTSFRCDSLGDSRAPRGCKTLGVTPVFNEKGIGPSIHRHLQSAKDAGLPGFSYLEPLRRQTNAGEIRRNREFSCGMVTGPRPQGMDCDEYPFASTIYLRNGPERKVATYTWCGIKDTGLIVDPGQGDQPLSSVCLISSSENRRSGGRLIWFYRKTRTLNFDTFFVTF